MEQKRLNARIKNAMIPDEFKDARFDTYKITNDAQKTLYDAMTQYLKEFADIKDQSSNSIGFIAAFGEQRLKEIKDKTLRAKMKKIHNNFGLGKTHLQVAAAKWLMRHGYPTLVVSDVSLMEDLSASRTYDDNGIDFNKILGGVIQTPVLVWDDIGKVKTSGFRLDMYYQIINERYKTKRPIIFSSNEDLETLTEKIGDAAASKLFGMSKGRIYAVEGEDFRLKG
ncbi:ATP-binding protein [Tepidibacillus decaturensis]|uniref:DNA replication protein n=1 Tax=Tepidibacillus decaturensis TaxID=1413211 RepID=A0A135L7L2_9BACI|nr:ATP-binding protein [Tepidibacillus decaturensis]KXG44966.1 DNA replication protein [Tepidibacillus decaturensis]